jgi:hypothetical protein
MSDSKRRTKRAKLNLPKLDGSKESKKKYNRLYWLKVSSKKPKKKQRRKK